MDGGMNDIQFVNWIVPSLNASEKNAEIDALTARSGADLEELLIQIGVAFPEAQIVVVGYYPVLSDASRGALSGLELFLSLVVPDIDISWSSIPPSATVDSALIDATIRQTAYNLDQLHFRMQEAVDAANAELGVTNIQFVDPEFGAENSMYAPNSFLFELYLENGIHLRSSDGLLSERQHICAQIFKGAFGSRKFCECTGAAHPNQKGAQRYLDRIMSVL